MRVHKRVPPAAYALLEQEYGSKEEVRSMIVEAIQQEEELIRQASKAEGKAEGKVEQQRLIAQRMLAKGYALALIADLLTLSEDAVRALLTDDTACL
jgi:predicted transposase YdaD